MLPFPSLPANVLNSGRAHLFANARTGSSVRLRSRLLFVHASGPVTSKRFKARSQEEPDYGRRRTARVVSPTSSFRLTQTNPSPLEITATSIGPPTVSV